jgi:DNA polymerase-3 subunit alpha
MTGDHKRRIVERAGEEIKTFARYGFNKAHTVEYGHICYRNAYLKSHYPVAFYAALLNSETEDPKRQTVIIRDMLKHGVTLLPPLINESEAEFTMTDQSTVRFGLAAVKNVGDKALDIIMEDRRIRGPYKSVEEFRVRIPATICNVTAMESLAKCGAFDEVLHNGLIDMGNRATLVASIRDICTSMSKITKKKNKNTPAPTVDQSLSRLRDGAATYAITRAEEDKIQYSIWEKEILKYYISAHPIDAYIDEMERWTAIGDVEPDDLPNEFYIAGFYEGCHETIIKKEGRNKGKAMGFVTIGTQYRAYEATLFPGIYESCLPYMIDGNPVVLKGKKDTYKGKTTIQGVYMRNMTNSGIRDCPECHIRVSDAGPLDLMALKQIFDEHPGVTVVYIHVLDGYDDITIQTARPVALNDRIIDYCASIGWRLSYKPI